MEAGGVADSLLSGACVLFTLGMFSTGLSDLRHMRMARRVDNVQFLPFLTTDVNKLCSSRLQPCWGSCSWALATFGSWYPTLRPGFSSWASSAVSSPSVCTSHHWLTW
ncbi:solute carrier family 50 member 1 [Rhinolophus ferrumequinum]|uniref:Solute carrier family 50 member 1 n=1 Tax=Rhinolophus ferrumequinum TaxID=59479 RepID=A0A7J7SZC2_RHIFE|nr:solute carrier family 50 member 1 [Rhinolophus ferrumequinum]